MAGSADVKGSRSGKSIDFDAWFLVGVEVFLGLLEGRKFKNKREDMLAQGTIFLTIFFWKAQSLDPNSLPMFKICVDLFGKT